MRSRRLIIIGAACSIAAASCYPGEIVSVTQLASITTLVDSQAPLREARTFALSNNIVHAQPEDGTATLVPASQTRILQQIRKGFLDYGWREITAVAVTPPDVVVLTTAFDQTHTGVAYTGWWGGSGYGGWPAGYDDSWGWGYPPGAVEFTYETGTLLITMLDLRHGDPTTKTVPLLWVAGVHGVLTAASLNGALDGIAQAFVQSPYLVRP